MPGRARSSSAAGTSSSSSFTQNQILVGGRLTLESGVPVSTTDQTGKTTIYYTPFIHDQIGLYDGASAWSANTFTETSLALGTLTSGKNYDVFGYLSSGTFTLESLAWTSDTARATSLTRTNGVWLKTGDLTKRYLGTFRTTSTTATESSDAKRFLWNADNQVDLSLWRAESNASWTYGTASFRQANASTANQVEAVVGLTGTWLDLILSVDGQITANVPVWLIGIGENSTTAIKSTRCSQGAGDGAPATGCDRMSAASVLRYYAPLGYTYWTWLELAASATVTFYGTSGTDRSGMYGSVKG